MAAKTFSHKIVVLISSLLLLTTLAVILTLWIAVYNHVQKQVDINLNVGVNVFEQILNTRESQLIKTTDILTSDFAFRRAVATNDGATIESALINHAGRIDADLMSIVTLEGELVATTSVTAIDYKTFITKKLLQTVIEQGSLSTVVTLNNVVYQVMLLTVNAPLPIAVTVVGFAVDIKLASELSNISKLDISLVSKQHGNSKIILTTLDKSYADNILNVLDQKSSIFRLPFSDKQILKSIEYNLSSTDSTSISAYLTDDLNNVYAEFDILQVEIGLITILAIFITLTMGMLFARTLSKPLYKLARFSNEIARGNYDVDLEVDTSTQEIKELSIAFNSMQRDIKQRENHIGYQASHDLLTGLINRSRMTEIIEEWVKENTSFTLVGINVVNFRSINDMFGHPIGDGCLQIIAKRLEQSCHYASRLSGADFIAFIPGEANHSQIDALQEQLVQAYNIDTLNIELQVNLGVIQYPESASDVETVLRRMEIAIDYAKQNNLSVHYYADGQEEDYIKRLALVTELRTALTDKSLGLEMFYQPKLNLKTNKVTRMEALIRWIHPEKGFIAPDVFIPIAEQSGLINLLTVWVISEVTAQLAVWYEKDIRLQVAINLSAQDLVKPEILDFINFQINQFKLPTKSLAFEVTESEIMKNPEVAIELLQNFRTAGFELAIDDFGTGYSSLSQLKNMPVTELKIDREFVMTLVANEENRIIVKSTIQLAHNFGMQLIAEGVEDEDALKLLSDWGCEWAQGYYISKAMPAGQVASWVNEYNSTTNIHYM